MSLSFFKIFILLLTFYSPLYAGFNRIPDADNINDIKNITNELEYYVDSNADSSFDEITLFYAQGKFKKSSHRNLTFGFTQAAVWVVYNMHYLKSGVNDDRYFFIEYPMIDEIEVFIPEKEGKYVKYLSGNNIPIDQRDVKRRKFIIPLNHGNIRGNVYFKFKTVDDSLDVSLSLLSTEGVIDRYITETSIHSAYFGIVFIIFIYFLSIYIATRDSVYLLYICYVTCMVLTQAGIHGYLYKYIATDNYFYSQLLRNFGATGALVFALLFTCIFLNLRKNFPLLRKTIWTFSGILVLFYIFTYFFRIIDTRTFSYFYYYFLVCTVIIAVISGILSLKKFIFAKYYLLAFSLTMLFGIFFAMRLLNIYPDFFNLYFLEVGEIFQISFLSIALAKKMRMEKNVQEETEKKLKESRMEVLKIRNEVLEKNLDLARALQFGLIPDLSKKKKINSLYMPMEEVGGDFFDIMDLDQNVNGIFFADVTGHGVQAAFITAIMKSALSLAWKNHNEGESSWLLDPSESFLRINEIFLDYNQNHYISAIYGVYHNNSGEFRYISAMHPPLLIITRDIENKKSDIYFKKVTPQAPLLGLLNQNELSQDKYRESIVTLPENGWLLLYSDGLMDCIQYDFHLFETGIDSLINTPLYDLFKNAWRYTGEEFLKVMKEKINEHLRTLPPDDDICLLLIER